MLSSGISPPSSPSSRRAWIEIVLVEPSAYLTSVALLAEGVDRNSMMVSATSGEHTSPSSRRAWIEIRSCGGPCPQNSVALLAEGVDRNVAPRRTLTLDEVALLAEGVDRNKATAPETPIALKSPSSRRAWIEI